MKERDIAQAYIVLSEMREALDGMIFMTERMAEAAKSCDATGLSFAAQMMVESLEQFKKEITTFVSERAVP